ncbi:MAG: hypothetical protein IPL61_29405 [Myxococcales bacterium]|nr:hypothetical protein [Myxococcales bacterium]
MKQWLLGLALALGVVAVGGCGPSAAQVHAARTAQYHAPASEVFAAAVAALHDNRHGVGRADPVAGQAMSLARWYEVDGTFVAKDAAGQPLLRGGEVVVVFEVAVTPAGDAVQIDVVPHVQQFRSGYAALFPIPAGDPTMPGWIVGLVDQIYLKANARLQRTLAPPQQAPPGPPGAS